MHSEVQQQPHVADEEEPKERAGSGGDPFSVEGEDGSTGRQLSRGFDLNFGRDELTSGGQREHRMDVLIENLKAMELDPEEFEFYVAGFRHGVPPHAGWGLGVERILMKLTGSKNVRETVLFPRDRRRVSP